jgi:hypothetical protein
MHVKATAVKGIPNRKKNNADERHEENNLSQKFLFVDDTLCNALYHVPVVRFVLNMHIVEDKASHLSDFYIRDMDFILQTHQQRDPTVAPANGVVGVTACCSRPTIFDFIILCTKDAHRSSIEDWHTNSGRPNSVPHYSLYHSSSRRNSFLSIILLYCAREVNSTVGNFVAQDSGPNGLQETLPLVVSPKRAMAQEQWNSIPRPIKPDI